MQQLHFALSRSKDKISLGFYRNNSNKEKCYKFSPLESLFLRSIHSTILITTLRNKLVYLRRNTAKCEVKALKRITVHRYDLKKICTRSRSRSTSSPACVATRPDRSKRATRGGTSLTWKRAPASSKIDTLRKTKRASERFQLTA